jgi:hypothetical protein
MGTIDSPKMSTSVQCRVAMALSEDLLIRWENLMSWNLRAPRGEELMN